MSKVYTAQYLRLQRLGDMRGAADWARLHAVKLAEERGPISQQIAKAENPMQRALLTVQHGEALRLEREAAEAAAEQEQVAVKAPLPTGPQPAQRETDQSQAWARLAMAATEGAK